MSGPLKVHALHRKGDGPKISVFAGQPLCDNPRAVEFTMRPWYDEGRDISCHICLWRAGLYVPLVKLREHQEQAVPSTIVDGLALSMGRKWAEIAVYGQIGPVLEPRG